MFTHYAILAQRFSDDGGRDWTDLLYLLFFIVPAIFNGVTKWYRDKYVKEDPGTDAESATNVPPVPTQNRPTPKIPTVKIGPSPLAGNMPTALPTERFKPPIVIPAFRPRPAPEAKPQRPKPQPLPQAVPVQPQRTASRPPSRPSVPTQSADRDQSRSQRRLAKAPPSVLNSTDHTVAGWRLATSSDADEAPRRKPTRSATLQRLLQRDDIRAAIVLSELLRPPLALRDDHEQSWG